MKTRNQPSDGEPSPESIVGYRLLPGVFNIQLQRAQRGVRAFASRTWGDYHRFLTGKLLEPGEREVYRLRLQSAAVMAVDRQVRMARYPTCILTDRRLMVHDGHGHFIQIRRPDIRAVGVQRQDDLRTGPSYYVAIARVGSGLHDPRGDISLYCQDRRECDDLVAALG